MSLDQYRVDKRAYQDDAPPEMMTMMKSVLALLRAMDWMYRTHHWQSGGGNFYGAHLLFMRLYEGEDPEEGGGTVDEIDALAEKMVGYFGDEAVNPMESMEQTEAWLKRWLEVDCPIKRSLMAEKDFQGVLKQLRDTLDGTGALPLGLDDWIAATASDHESHIYLLQQLGESHEHGKTASWDGWTFTGRR